MDPQRDIDAVVAHGLLNSLAVISGAAATILEHGHTLAEAEVRTLTRAIDEQSVLFIDGLQVVIRHASDTFADAATAVSLAGGVADHVLAGDRELALQTLVRRAGLLRQVLDGLVRGLPPEVLTLLDDRRP